MLMVLIVRQNGVGHTCGEEVESTWARTNPLGPSIWKIGPGAYHKILNDQWGGLNFWRILVFCEFFLLFCVFLQ